MDKFEAMFENLVDDIITNLKTEEPDAVNAVVLDRLRTLLHYSVPHGTGIRGFLVPFLFQHIVEDPTEEQMKLASVLGWCLQVFQTSLLIIDDIMDVSSFRWNKPCWHKLQTGNSLIAINDAVILEQWVYRLLRQYFSKDPVLYSDLVNIFHDNTYKLSLGQQLDILGDLSQIYRDKEIFDFTEAMEQYRKTVKYKAGYAILYLAFVLALRLSGRPQNDHKSLYKDVEKVSIDIGMLCQVLDDHQDWCGQDKLDKCVDIGQGKVNWCYLQARRLCEGHHEEENILIENYGKGESDCLQAVVTLYEHLNLEQKFKKFQDEISIDIKQSAIEFSTKYGMTGLEKALIFVLDKILSIENVW